MLPKAKKYKITNKVLAKYLGYSNDNTFNNSTAKDRILKALEKIITHIESEIIHKIEE